MERKGTLRLNGAGSYINLGEVRQFRGGLQRCGVRVWLRGEPLCGDDDDATPADQRSMCLLGMLYKDRLVCEITLLDAHRTAFMIRDADGRTLRAESTVQIANKMWRELHWIVEDAADNRMTVYLNGQKVKLMLTHAESPRNFAPMSVSTLKSFFPSDCLVGGCPDPEAESKVAHCFRGWVKELSLYVGNPRVASTSNGALIPLFRWPMGAGVRSILPEVITRNAAMSATTCKCVWDADEWPPTSLSLAGREALHIPLGDEVPDASWRISLWAKPKQPPIVLHNDLAVPPPEDGGLQRASSMPCLEMAFASGIRAALLLNHPQPEEVTFEITSPHSSEVASFTLAVDMYGDQWREVVVGTLTGHEIEVSVGGTRGHANLPKSFYTGGLRRPGSRKASPACTPNVSPRAKSRGAKSSPASSPAESPRGAGTHRDPAPAPLQPQSLSVCEGYHGYLQKVKVLDAQASDVLSELLLDEGVGDVCRNTVPGAPVGTVVTPDGGCWRPTAPPPFFLYVNPEGRIDIPLALADKTHLPDGAVANLDNFAVEFFVKTAPPGERAALVSGALGADRANYFVMELSGGGEKVCVTLVAEGQTLTLVGDSVICDGTWHKVTWELNYDRTPPVEMFTSLCDLSAREPPSKAKCKPTQRLLIDGVVVGLTTVQAAEASRYPARFDSLVPDTIVLGGSEVSGFVMTLTVTQHRKELLLAPLLDRSGFAHTVLPSGSKAHSKNVSWASTPVAKCALSCDGKATYINIGDTNPHFSARHFNSFAIDLWIKCADPKRHQVLWSVNDAHHSELEAMVSLSLNGQQPNSMSFLVRDSVGRVLHGYGCVDVFDSAWHSVNLQVIAASQNNVRLYVDSKVVDIHYTHQESPHSYEPLPDLLFGIAAQPCLPFPVHHYEGLIETFTITAPWNGEMVGHWPLGEGQGATANETSGNSLVGDIISPIWTYTVKPSLSLNLLDERSTLTTVLDDGVYTVEFWLLSSTPFTADPVTLFTIKTTSEEPLWEVTLNQAPEGCILERQSAGLIMVELCGGGVTAVADCGNAFSMGLWRKVTFKFTPEYEPGTPGASEEGTPPDEVSRVDTEPMLEAARGGMRGVQGLRTGVRTVDSNALGGNALTVALNDVPQPLAYFDKADVAEEFRTRGRSAGGCVLVLGDAERGLDACVRCLVAYDEGEGVLGNFPLSHSLLDVSECNRTAFVSNFKWNLKCLPPSAPTFNGTSGFGILGTVGDFGGKLHLPWRLSMRLKCCLEWGSRNRVQSLLSRQGEAEVLELALHSKINNAHAPWWVKLVLTDQFEQTFEVCWNVACLADGDWHMLELTVESVEENDTVFAVDGRVLTPLFGTCEVPKLFTPWVTPLYLGCRPGRQGRGISQHYSGSFGDIALSYWPERTEPLHDAARRDAAMWNLGTGYGNEIPDRGSGAGESSLGSLVSCTWAFAADAVPAAAPPPPPELRDIGKEAKVCVSRWCQSVASAVVKRTNIGGIPVTHFEDGEGWFSGGESPQWIQFDMQRSVALHGIDLQTRCDTPIDPEPVVPFNAVHEIWVGAGDEPTQKVHTLDIQAQDVMWLKWRPDTPLPLVRTVTIVTKQSPYLVGWRSVRLLVPSAYKTKLRIARESLDLQGTERPLCINDDSHLVKLFRKYDVDRSGHISRKEMRRFLKDYQFGMQLTDPQINRLLARVLRTNDDQQLVSYQEFCVLALKMSQW